MSSREPTRTAAVFRRLPLGSVLPRGWLANQLRLQADGLTGTLEDIWPDVGPTSAWLGGAGENWERGPYYLDGLVPLAHLLKDAGLQARAAKWVDAILSSQREDGFFGPRSNDDWWPRMVALKALIQHAEATNDSRIVPFLRLYFKYQLATLPSRPLEGWGKWRGAENSLAVAWLYDRTGEHWLRELGDLLEAQTIDWNRYFTEFPHRDITTEPRLSTHVVNVAMGVKGPAVREAFHPAPGHRAALLTGLANLDRYHGQVHGMFSGDEHLAGTGAARGTELCAVVEMMFSLQEAIRVFGDPSLADRLERIAFNLLPAATDAEVRTHQYHQQANQVLVSIAPRDWTAADDDCTLFGLQPNFGCCTANMHQGWPKLLQSMWMTGAGGALHALVHGPSVVRVDDEFGTLAIEADTTYPFGTSIRYTVTESDGSDRVLRFRVPRWAEGATLDGPHGSTAEVIDGYLSLAGSWQAGESLELKLPRRPRLNERPNGAIGIDLGALVMVHCPGEVWERLPGSVDPGDWEVRARWGWNIGLAVDDSILSEAKIEVAEPGRVPFGLSTGRPEQKVDGVPVRLRVPGRPVPDWGLHRNSAAEPPVLENASAFVGRQFALVPYGCARIRVAEFPRLRPEHEERWDMGW